MHENKNHISNQGHRKYSRLESTLCQAHHFDAEINLCDDKNTVTSALPLRIGTVLPAEQCPSSSNRSHATNDCSAFTFLSVSNGKCHLQHVQEVDSKIHYTRISIVNGVRTRFFARL